MNRREFITLLGGAAGYSAIWPRAGRAQSHGKMARIGMLWHARSADEESIYLAAFRQGLADFGYVEGGNIIVEHRFPAEIPERFQTMAAELVGLKMDDVLVAFISTATRDRLGRASLKISSRFPMRSGRDNPVMFPVGRAMLFHKANSDRVVCSDKHNRYCCSCSLQGESRRLSSGNQ